MTVRHGFRSPEDRIRQIKAQIAGHEAILRQWAAYDAGTVKEPPATAAATSRVMRHILITRLAEMEVEQ